MCNFKVTLHLCNHHESTVTERCDLATECSDPISEGNRSANISFERSEWPCSDCMELATQDDNDLDPRERLEYRADALSQWLRCESNHAYDNEDIEQLHVELWAAGKRLHPFFQSPFPYEGTMEFGTNSCFLTIYSVLRTAYACAPERRVRKNAAWKLAFLDEMLRRQKHISSNHHVITKEDKKYDWKNIVGSTWCPETFPDRFPNEYPHSEPDGSCTFRDGYWEDYEFWERDGIERRIPLPRESDGYVVWDGTARGASCPVGSYPNAENYEDRDKLISRI